MADSVLVTLPRHGDGEMKLVPREAARDRIRLEAGLLELSRKVPRLTDLPSGRWRMPGAALQDHGLVADGDSQIGPGGGFREVFGSPSSPCRWSPGS